MSSCSTGPELPWPGRANPETSRLPPRLAPGASRPRSASRSGPWPTNPRSAAVRRPRGHLVVTRRLPTGIVRPDVLEAAFPVRRPDGASRASPRVGRAGPPRRALPRAGGAGGRGRGRPQGRRPAVGARWRLWRRWLSAWSRALRATGVVAARLLLLLAVPYAETGPFAPILPDVSGLLSTPVDIGLTGFVALILLRSVLASGRESFGGAASKVAARAVAGGAAVAAAFVPAFLGLAGGRSAPSVLLGLGLFTGPPEAPLAAAGLVAASSAFLGLAALLTATAARAGPDGARPGCRGAGAHGLVVLRRPFRSVDGRPGPRERPSCGEPFGEDLDVPDVGPPLEVGRRRAPRGGRGLRDRGRSVAGADPRHRRAPRKGRNPIESRPGTARGRGARCVGGASRGRSISGPGLPPEAARR